MSHAEADDKFAQTVNNMFGANISGSAESNERVEVTVLANADGVRDANSGGMHVAK